MGDCACGGIDVHTHVVPFSFPPLGSGAGYWPRMVAGTGCHRNVMIHDKVYRTVAEAAWDGSVRVKDMDELGVSMQVISPMPELLSYWMPLAEGAQLTRYLNESIARMVSTHPGRFYGLGAVPLQDIGAAIAELRFLVEELGLAGVEIAGNINGDVIGLPRFDPFWQAVQDFDVAVFVHPLRPAAMDRLVGPKPLQQLLAFPTEVGLAAASMLTGGVLERYPKLRVAFSHGGGTLATLVRRLQHGWDVNPAVKEVMGDAPLSLARRLYVDDLVYHDKAIIDLMEFFGDTQVMVGSDYPFRIRDKEPMSRVRRLPVTPEQRARLAWRNATDWLGASQTARVDQAR